MTPDVRTMIELRHGAEQRGHYSILGRLLYLWTDHGKIDFPAHDGDWTGPDVAYVSSTIKEPSLTSPGSTILAGLVEIPDSGCGGALMLLGEWTGLPAVRKVLNPPQPCPKCRHDCDMCGLTGKKQCEEYRCGGRGWVPGPAMLACPGPGCSKETGNFKGDCKVCGGSGQIVQQVECPMCHGTKLMTCPRCKGTLKFSTGKRGGSIDWSGPACPACDGSGLRGEMQRQDVTQFTNATLVIPKTKTAGPKSYLVLGPIREFAIHDYQSTRPRIFDVVADALGDLLVMLVPRGARQKPRKAYLVGGIVREREMVAKVSA